MVISPSPYEEIPTMMTSNKDRMSRCHVVAMPFPGRGHINPMMNVCMLLASKGLLVTFVVTEEWLSLIDSTPKMAHIHLRSIPNVLPSELNRGADYHNFIEAVFTKMEGPFDQLLDQLETPAGFILADFVLSWAVDVANRRNISIVLLYPQAPFVFALYYHSDLLALHGHFPLENATEREDEFIDYIPGIPSIRVADLPAGLTCKSVFQKRWPETISYIRKVQCLIFTSFYELQPSVIDTLRTKVPIPIYTIASIPYMSLRDPAPSKLLNGADVKNWLDLQPENSVLYVSLGSFLPISGAQMHEIAMGLLASGVRFLWIVRGEASHLQEACGDMGLVVPWCEQLKVLCHSSVGAFLTHCGWNSTLEGVYAGVLMLTFPLGIDQMTDSKFIVDDWKIGLRVKNALDVENVVGGEGIAEIIRLAMDQNGDEYKELRRRAKELQRICQQAIKEEGSSYSNLQAFTDFIPSLCTLANHP